MTWIKVAEYTKLGEVADQPDGCVAIQKKLNKLKK